MSSTTAENFSHRSIPTTGILIANLGTPDAPTKQALRKYLGEFLWDPRVVRIPRPIWWLILNGIILNTRPAKSAQAYQSVWTDEGAPLLKFSLLQKQAIQQKLETACKAPVKIALGMRYGNPSIAQALQELKAASAQRILVLPLYPQYSSATSASTFDAVSQVMENEMWVPNIRFVSSYHDHPDYIAALVKQISEFWQQNGKPKKLFFSFHGMPAKTLTDGDPYHCHCHKTARLVAEGLGLNDDEWIIAFQSRFGKAEWLKPYADKTLEELGKSGLESVDVVCPGFSADCLETLEEMAVENRDNFQNAGGGQYRYIPALNDNPEHIDALLNIIREETANWPLWDDKWDAEAAQSEANRSFERAKALGADS